VRKPQNVMSRTSKATPLTLVLRKQSKGGHTNRDMELGGFE
jgi:hypothetical protein